MTKRLFQYFNQMRHEWVMMTVKVWELTQIDYLGEDSEKHFGHNSWVCFPQIYILQIWQTLVHRLLRLGQNLQKPRFFFTFLAGGPFSSPTIIWGLFWAFSWNSLAKVIWNLRWKFLGSFFSWGFLAKKSERQIEYVFRQNRSKK